MKYEEFQAKEIAKFFAKHFIARSDVFAIQRPNGAYNPVERKITMKDLLAHINGDMTLGHYLLNTESKCKLFAFDIDFKKSASLPTRPLPRTDDEVKIWLDSFKEQDARAAWANRSHPARQWMKTSLRTTQTLISEKIKYLELPTLSAYTGSKGAHVYAFTGLMDAKHVREGAEMVMDETGFRPSKGNNFYQYNDALNPEYSLFEIEIFPKQTHVEQGQFGNLMRLPLGRNLKSKDPTFFINEYLPLGDLVPMPIGEVFKIINDESP